MCVNIYICVYMYTSISISICMCTYVFKYITSRRRRPVWRRRPQPYGCSPLAPARRCTPVAPRTAPKQNVHISKSCKLTTPRLIVVGGLS